MKPPQMLELELEVLRAIVTTVGLCETTSDAGAGGGSATSYCNHCGSL